MDNSARTLVLVTLLISVCAGCEPPATASIALQLPDRMNVERSDVVVYDDASCAGVDVVGGTEVDRISGLSGAAFSIEVAPGDLTFGVSALDTDGEIARGCASATLRAGEASELQIGILDTTCFGDSADKLAFGETYLGDTLGRPHYYRFVLEREFTPALLAIATKMVAGTSDTAINVRQACSDSETELMSANLPPFSSAQEVPVLEPGVFYLTMDSAEAPGPYELEVLVFVDRIF